MPNEQPQASRSADTFTLPEFPEVKMQGGDRLHPDGYELARILKGHTAHTSKRHGAEMIWEWLRQVGYSRIKTVEYMARLGIAALLSPTPKDREIFRPPNTKTQRIVHEILDKSITPESRIIGTDHIVQFMQMNRKGVKSALYSTHATELDPVIVQILMQRLQRASTNTQTAEAAQDLAGSLIAVIGHRVRLDSFRRIFIEAIQAIFTVSPKYRARLQGDEKSLVQLSTDNGARLMNHLMADPNYTVMALPQGGLTRGGQIAFQGIMGPASRGVNILPAFIEEPDGFLRPDAGDDICYGPANVDLYIGEPFAPHTRSTEALVLQFRDRLRAVGANVEEFQWGYMHRKRGGKTPEEEFVEL